eukprot:2807050-Rhodomonas_salina.1
MLQSHPFCLCTQQTGELRNLPTLGCAKLSADAACAGRESEEEECGDVGRRERGGRERGGERGERGRR